MKLTISSLIFWALNPHSFVIQRSSPVYHYFIKLTLPPLIFITTYSILSLNQFSSSVYITITSYNSNSILYSLSVFDHIWLPVPPSVRLPLSLSPDSPSAPPKLTCTSIINQWTTHTTPDTALPPCPLQSHYPDNQILFTLKRLICPVSSSSSFFLFSIENLYSHSQLATGSHQQHLYSTG